MSEQYTGLSREKLVTAASFATPTEASLAASRLEQEGIRAFLENENTIAADFLLSNAIGGVRVTVAESSVLRAREILQMSPAVIEKDDLDEFDGYADEPFRCPKCHRKELDFVPFSGLAVLSSLLLLGLPLLFVSRAKRCRACGHVWQ